MSKLVTAYVELIPTMQGAESIITRQLVPSASAAGTAGGQQAGAGLLGGMRGAIAPIAGIVAGAFATSAIVSWGQEQISALSRIETINAQTQAAITSTGGAAGVTQAHISDLAGSLEAMTAVEGEAIQSGANLLLTFTNVRNGVGEGNDIFDQAVTSLTDLSVAMGTDPSAAATMLGKALNDPIAGLASLSRVGIQFTNDQRSMIESMVAAGDVMGAQSIILGELNTQFGGSGAAYAETYAGRVALIGHEWGAFGETIFGGVMPAMTTLAGGLLNVIQYLNQSGVAQAFGDALSSGLGGVGSVVEGLTGALQSGGITAMLGQVVELRAGLFDAAMNALPGLAEGMIAALPGILTFITGTLIPQLVNEVTTLVPLLVTTIATLLPALVNVLATAVPQMVNGLTALIPQLITTLTTLIPQVITSLVGMLPILVEGASQLFMGILMGLIAALPAFYTTLYELIPAVVTSLLEMAPVLLTSAITLFMNLVMGLLDAIPTLITTMVDILPMIVTTIVGMVPTILTTAIDLFLQLVIAIGTALPQIITALVGILPVLVSAVVGMIPVLWGAAIDLFEALVEGLPPVIPLLVQALVDMAPALVDAVISIVPALIGAGGDLIGGLIDGLLGAAGQVGDVLVGIAEDAVGGFLDFFGIASPSRLMRDHAKWIPAGMVVGIESGAADVQDAMDSLSTLPAAATYAASVNVGASSFDVNPTAAAYLERRATAGGPLVHQDIHMVRDDPEYVMRVTEREYEAAFAGEAS